MAIVQTSVQQYPRIWHFLGRSVVRAWASWMLIIVIILTATPPTALAHSKVEVGAHRIVVGWASEPPLVGLRNAITVEISRDQVPLQDSKTSLILELRYAGRSRRSPLTPTATPGLYTVDLIPTVRGQYTVHVSGQIDGVAIDQALEPEEVLPATHYSFPKPNLQDMNSSPRWPHSKPNYSPYTPGPQPTSGAVRWVASWRSRAF